MLELFIDPNLQSVANNIIASCLFNIGEQQLAEKFKPTFYSAYKKALKDVCKDLKKEKADELKAALSKQDYISKLYSFQLNGEPIEIEIFADPFNKVLGQGISVKSFFDCFRKRVSEKPELANQLQLLYSESIVKSLLYFRSENKAEHKAIIDLLEIVIENQNKQTNIEVTIGYNELPPLPEEFSSPEKSLESIAQAFTTNKAVLIYGPAGSGKSVIASKMAHNAGEASRPVFWFRFQEFLTDLDSFKRNLLGFLQKETNSEETNVNNLLSSSKALLVFDDLHKIEDEKLISFISTIVNILSSTNNKNCTLIITSRENKDLPTSKFFPFSVDGLAEGEAKELINTVWKLNLEIRTLTSLLKALGTNPIYLRFFYDWFNIKAPDTTAINDYIKHAPEEDSNLKLYLIENLYNAFGGAKSIENKLLMAVSFYRIPETEQFIKKLFTALEGDAFIDTLNRMRHQTALVQYLPEYKRFYLHDLLADFYYHQLENRDDLHLFCADIYNKRCEKEDSWVNNIEASHHYLKAGVHDKSAEIIEPVLFQSISFGYYWKQIYKILARLDFSAVQNDQLRLNIISNYAHLLFKKGEWDKALEYYKQSLDGKEKIGDVHGVAKIYNNLGVVYQVKGEWDKAVEFDKKSLQISEEMGAIYEIAATYNNLGIVYQAKGEWDKAVEFYNNSLDGKEKVGDVHGMALTYNNLGLVYQDKGEWDKAVEFYKKSLQISEEMGDVQLMAKTYNNLGIVYQDKGEWDKAVEFDKKSLQISEEIGDVQLMAKTYNNLGLVYTTKGEWDKAVEFYNKDLQINEEIGDVHGMAQTYGNIALLKLNKEEYKESLHIFFQILFLFNKLGAIPEQKQTLRIISSFKEKLNQDEMNSYLSLTLQNSLDNGVTWGRHTVITKDEAKDIYNDLFPSDREENK